MPALAVGEHGHLDVGFSIGPLGLRVALLAAVLTVAAFAMLRGFLAEPDRRTTIVLLTTATGAVALELLLSGGFALPEQIVPLLLAALAVPLYLTLSSDPARATTVARTRRLGPWVFWLFAAGAGVRFAQAWLDNDTVRAVTLLHTGVLLGLVAVAWFTVSRPRTGVLALRAGAAALAIALVAGVAQATVSRPPDQLPGVATTAEVEVGDRRVNVVLVPNLPGWNLVHVDAGDVELGTDREALAPPDPTGWLAVRLPPGRGEVWVADRRGAGSFATDTGTVGSAPGGLVGPDGPECASALLGRALATGSVSNGVECPADTLTPADARELTSTVERLADQGTTSVAVATDESPRGRAAADTVGKAATANGMTVTEPGRGTDPLIVASGWTGASAVRSEGPAAASRAYFAPWLADLPPLTADRTGSLRWYVTAFQAAYPTLQPSAAGFRAWLAARTPLT